uniref:cAMP-regulated phosphoprotein 19-like n=1 Tax=Myxine glutinosa TaxID=7769 RepID=UPI00358E3991
MQQQQQQPPRQDDIVFAKPEASDKENQQNVRPEQMEAVKLHSKYPNLAQRSSGSSFLMKRMQRGQQKYFDSGDYNMDKAYQKHKSLASGDIERSPITGDHIPTPQDLPQRRPSLLTSKLVE